ncbi:MAG: hypothetical protein ACFFBD_18795 [Candidatus Hodarchaeota archaeon]
MFKLRYLILIFKPNKILRVEPIPNIQRFGFTLVDQANDSNVIVTFYLPFDYALLLAQRIDVLATQHIFGGTLGTKEQNLLILVRAGGGKPSRKNANYEIEARNFIAEYRHEMKHPFRLTIVNAPGDKTEEGKIQIKDEENQIELEININTDEAQRLALAMRLYVENYIRKEEDLKKIFLKRTEI